MDLLGLLYYVLIWPFVCIWRAASDDVLVRVGLKRAVPSGRPVWFWR
jgi:hypothetical protein